MKAVRPVIVSNVAPYIQMTSVGSHSMSERENEGNQEREDLLAIGRDVSKKL